MESGLHFQIESIPVPIGRSDLWAFHFPASVCFRFPITKGLGLDMGLAWMGISSAISVEFICGISNKEKVAQCLNEHPDSVTFGKRWL